MPNTPLTQNKLCQMGLRSGLSFFSFFGLGLTQPIWSGLDPVAPARSLGVPSQWPGWMQTGDTRELLHTCICNYQWIKIHINSKMSIKEVSGTWCNPYIDYVQLVNWVVIYTFLNVAFVRTYANSYCNTLSNNKILIQFLHEIWM